MCLAQGVLVFSWWERVKKDDSRDVNEQMIRFFFFNARWKSSWHRPRYWGERLSCPAPAHTHMAHDINKTEHTNKTHTHAKLPPLTGQTNSWSLKQDQWGCFFVLFFFTSVERRESGDDWYGSLFKLTPSRSAEACCVCWNLNVTQMSGVAFLSDANRATEGQILNHYMSHKTFGHPKNTFKVFKDVSLRKGNSGYI